MASTQQVDGNTCAYLQNPQGTLGYSDFDRRGEQIVKMESYNQNRCYRRCKRNRKKRFKIKKRQEKRLEKMLRPTLESLSQLCISQPSTSRLDTTETELPSLAELHISQPPPRPLTTPNQSGISSLMQLYLPLSLTQEQPMHSPLPITPPPPSPIQPLLPASPPPSPIQPLLPASPPPPQPAPPTYDPSDHDNGNSGGEEVDNNNCVAYTPNVLAVTNEANVNFLRHYLQYFRTHSDLQN